MNSPQKVQLELLKKDKQTSAYFGEDDIVRVRDDHKRS